MGVCEKVHSFTQEEVIKAKIFILLLIFDKVKHTCNSGVITICVITFYVKKVITFCVGKLLNLALITLLHFALVLHCATIVIHFVSVRFCGDY